MLPSFPWSGRKNSKASSPSILRNSSSTKNGFSFALRETDRPLPESCAGLECRFERGRVRVHVATYQQAHGKIAETAAEETEL